MKTFKVLSPFKFAFGGIRVVEYQPGDEVTTDDADFEQTVEAEKWAKPAAGKKEDPPSPSPDEPNATGGDGTAAPAAAPAAKAPSKRAPNAKAK